MKKRFLGVAVLTAALTLATGITAFAGTWKDDTHGRYYENDDGSRPVYGGWFTDPDTGFVYGMDLDGYLMIDSVMGSYRTDGEGRRMDPTEEQLQRAEERRVELATRKSPSRETAAAQEAAKTGTAATTTTRSAYITEMKTFMDKIFIATRDARTNTTILPSAEDDNTHVTYGFRNPDGYHFISASTWKNTRPTSADYKEYAFDLTYHFDAAADDTDRHIYDDAYRQLMIAALGETSGQAAVDYVNEQRAAGATTFNHSGTTDSGNSYSITYNNNLLNLYVVCSEVVPAETEETTTEETAATEAAETYTEETAATTSRVITAGQGSAATEAEATEADDTAEATETEAAAE